MTSRSVTTFLIGLRLLRGTGRAGQARFLLMSLGCAMGVACLAAVLTIPAILSAHDSRAAAREPQPVTGVPHARSAEDTVFLTRQDPYGSQPFTRVFLSHPAGGNTSRPPGVEHLPKAGEVLVSPRLRETLAEQPGLAGLLPGRVTGTIGPEGLTGPDELYAYIGRSPGQLPPSARPLESFGSAWAPTPAVDSSTLDILRFALGCLVLLPLAVFLSVCARLSAEARARRLAALRLLGLSVKGTLRVNAVETVAAALLGALLGVGVYALANELLAQVGLPGLQWYPPDGRPSTTVLAVCLLACPGLAWFVGRHRAREAALRPLQVRRGSQPRAPKKYGMLLLLPGLGLICGYCALGALGRDTSDGPAKLGARTRRRPADGGRARSGTRAGHRLARPSARGHHSVAPPGARHAPQRGRTRQLTACGHRTRPPRLRRVSRPGRPRRTRPHQSAHLSHPGIRSPPQRSE